MSTLALDIGGANVKFASGRRCWSVPFALWKAPQRLLSVLRRHAPAFDELALTMTAELCDCFETKREGIEHVLRAASALAGRRQVRVWSTVGRFVSVAQARAQPLRVAAGNWHALASFVAARFSDGLLADTGSTTTDLIDFRNGRVTARGLTDMQRLAHHELVYLGARRTPLMALTHAVTFRRRRYGVMAEYFATTADTGVLVGRIAADRSDTDTADGRPLTRRDAAARVLRMIGADLDMLSVSDATQVARAFESAAVARIAQAIARHPRPPRVIVSGSGESLALAAVRQAWPRVRVVSLSKTIGPAASTAACAYALLQLAQERR